jgi:predicted component of type VI protein secretion system
MFIIFKNKNNYMETYSPEEVKKLIEMLKSIDAKVKKIKDAEPTKLEKQIRYLKQRLKFFNPTKKMLGYIINQAKYGKIKLDPILLEKLKDEFNKKD